MQTKPSSNRNLCRQAGIRTAFNSSSSIHIWMLGQVNVNDVWDSNVQANEGESYTAHRLFALLHTLLNTGQDANERRNGVMFNIQPYAISMVLGVR